MRIAVIGAGRMGDIRAEDLISGGAEVTIFNRRDNVASELAKKMNCSSAAYADLLKLDFDGYVVATATNSHIVILDQLIPLGKPILCEKPISLTVEETDTVIEKCAKYGTQIQVGFQRRFDPPILQAAKQVSSGQVGTLYAMHMYAHDHQPSTLEFLEGSGGIYRDLHVHDFDLVRWITQSEISKVYATQAVREHQQYAKYNDADVSLISLTTESGVQVAITGTRHNPVGHDVRFEIFGSKDSIVVGLNLKTPIHDIEGEIGFNQIRYTSFIERFRQAFVEESHAFIKLVDGKTLNPCPPINARQALRVAIACEESILSGSAVEL
jgi:myo-inositol 2-dehydrogenase / D-chiro-inositol 1-dehydrogenase|uniref:Gfo/Idh/MocA family protein n=1 Tax=Candidatus Planktophila sp. TaxID=2175601 RepID=UPI00404B2896